MKFTSDYPHATDCQCATCQQQRGAQRVLAASYRTHTTTMRLTAVRQSSGVWIVAYQFWNAHEKHLFSGEMPLTAWNQCVQAWQQQGVKS